MSSRIKQFAKRLIFSILYLFSPTVKFELIKKELTAKECCNLLNALKKSLYVDEQSDVSLFRERRQGFDLPGVAYLTFFPKFLAFGVSISKVGFQSILSNIYMEVSKSCKDLIICGKVWLEYYHCIKGHNSFQNVYTNQNTLFVGNNSFIVHTHHRIVTFGQYGCFVGIIKSNNCQAFFHYSTNTHYNRHLQDQLRDFIERYPVMELTLISYMPEKPLSVIRQFIPDENIKVIKKGKTHGLDLLVDSDELFEVHYKQTHVLIPLNMDDPVKQTLTK